MIGGLARAGSRSHYRHVPRYNHPYCTVRHLSDEVRERCEATPQYRRARAAGIAAENAAWAKRRADEAVHAAWVSNHPVLGNLGDYVFWTLFTISVVTLAIIFIAIAVK